MILRGLQQPDFQNLVFSSILLLLGNPNDFKLKVRIHSTADAPEERMLNLKSTTSTSPTRDVIKMTSPLSWSLRSKSLFTPAGLPPTPL